MSDLISTRDIRQIRELYKKDSKNLVELMLFESTKRFYEQKLNFKIVLPKVAAVDRNIVVKLFDVVRVRMTEVFNPNYKEDIMKDYDGISYFGDFMTTDALDVCLTETPIEAQLLMKENNGEELGEISGNMGKLLESLRDDGDKLQDELPAKYDTLQMLEEKVKRQKEILSAIERVEDISFFTTPSKEKKD